MIEVNIFSASVRNKVIMIYIQRRLGHIWQLACKILDAVRHCLIWSHLAFLVELSWELSWVSCKYWADILKVSKQYFPSEIFLYYNHITCPPKRGIQTFLWIVMLCWVWQFAYTFRFCVCSGLANINQLCFHEPEALGSLKDGRPWWYVFCLPLPIFTAV